MPATTAARERLTSAALTLHHPLDYYFALFLRAKETEGLKPRTLRYPERQGKLGELLSKVIVHLLRTKGYAAPVCGWLAQAKPPSVQ